MPSWNPSQSFIITTVGTGGTGGRPVTPEWQRWIAENVLLGIDPPTLVATMMRDGFDRDTATREVQAALHHPYLQAAFAARPEPAAPREVAVQRSAPAEAAEATPLTIDIYQLAADDSLNGIATTAPAGTGAGRNGGASGWTLRRAIMPTAACR